MTSDTIAKLAWMLPIETGITGSFDTTPIGVSQRQAMEMMHYANCYKNLRFGWDFARRAAEGETTFPAFLHEYDHFIWRAYKFIQGFDDPVIARAATLSTPGNAILAGQIHAMLVTNDVQDNTSYIASEMGIEETVLVAYEKLFFNVLDRKEEHSFISNLVYPEGRIVEGMKDYLEKAGVNDLLMRAGYNHGKDIVAYMAGFGKHPFSTYDAATGANKLDSIFMADGILYAALGFLHAPGATPIDNARKSIQAGKTGGNEQTQSSTFMSLADTLRQEVIAVSNRKVRAMAERAASK